ncbi:MAG: lytic transglycosylase domain-containing protein [Bdellovibrionaceae bacterium]|nr:lytic transglycosylase domain-containing protein [Pseudobdellovibrionaceae bacterium]
MPKYRVYIFILLVFGFIGQLLLSISPAKESTSTESPVIVHNKPLIWQTAAQLDSQLQEDVFYNFQPKLALEDPFSRVSSDFKIPESLFDRVDFWFDVYTKYDKNNHIIHHSRYPWIIFEVVDTSHFLKGSGPLWLRIQRGRDFVKARKKLYKKTIKQLAIRKNKKNTSPFEQTIISTLKLLPGNFNSNIKTASKFLRVQLGQKDFFVAGLENSNKYLNLMEKEFQNFNLPTELTRIPFVESSFNEKAQSRVGASGVWQIMPHVGKKYSIVNNYIDERNSPVKASHIAAKLLKFNYKVLKSWPLAVTAYNNGIGNIRKAIKRAHSNDLNIIIERNHKGAFKFASSNFYSSFLAALYAEKYHYEIFQEQSFIKAKAFQKVKYKLKRSWRPRTLAKKGDMEINKILVYNLDLKNSIKKNYLLPKGYTLLLPPDKANEFKARLF